MASKRLTRAERRAETRTELLDAAPRVFATQGFHAATLEEVAREAGYFREWTLKGRPRRRK